MCRSPGYIQHQERSGGSFNSGRQYQEPPRHANTSYNSIDHHQNNQYNNGGNNIEYIEDDAELNHFLDGVF